MLVLIKSGQMLNTNCIQKVDRCGNYTEITERDDGRHFSERFHQIWDETEVLWNRLLVVAKEKELSE